ncbi:MAG: O-methyltransferase [Gammaproteobacteria bacterium]
MSTIETRPAIERERRRLLARTDPLGHGGAYDIDWTISAAAAISKSPKQAGLLGAMVREFAPQQVVELGTNVGISAAYMALGTTGKMITLEASPARMTLARELHRNLGIENVEYVEGYFNDTLSTQLDRMPFVDFAFIDGHHEYQPTKDYCAAILPHAKRGAVFFFDDIRFSPGMWQAWSELSADDRFGLVLDFWTMGACVIRADSEPKIVVPPMTCF